MSAWEQPDDLQPTPAPPVHPAPRMAGRTLIVCALALLLVAVCLPRLTGWFDAMENSDVGRYVRLTLYFRGGDTPPGLPPAPFSYRVTVPWLAAQLPWSALFALRILSLVSTATAVAAIDRILVLIGSSPQQRLLGALLFICSFSTFAYGASGYIEPAVLALLALGTWAALAESWFCSALLLFLGALTKESTCILLAVAAARLGWSRWRTCLLLTASFVAGQLAVRTLGGSDPAFFWPPSWTQTLASWTRPLVYARLALCAGVPLPLALFVLRGRWRATACDPVLGPIFAGLGAALAVFAYAGVSARIDARFLWLTVPFTIPLGVGRWRTAARGSAT